MAGRKLTHDVKNNKSEYFKNYYHTKKHIIQCECGQSIVNHQRNKHIKSKKHLNGVLYFQSLRQGEETS
jgi:acetone carboxylase gamma subunit